MRELILHLARQRCSPQCALGRPPVIGPALLTVWNRPDVVWPTVQSALSASQFS